MKNEFYEMSCAYKRSAIEVSCEEPYSSLKLPTLDSNMYTSKNIVSNGKKLFDVVKFEDSFFFLISEKFKTVIEQNKLTGLEIVPVEIEGIDTPYYGIVITSIAGPITNLEALNDLETDKTEFDIDTWDGSDFFSLEGTILCACSEKAKNVIEAAKITNVAFESL